MAADDNYSEYDDDAGDLREGGSGDAGDGPAAAGGSGLKKWMNRRRGWLVIGILTILQGIFAAVMILLRSEGERTTEFQIGEMQELATEMLGYEVDIKQINQLLRVPGSGRRMTVGLDVALILGQLPEERIQGAARPTPEEMAYFIEVVKGLEPDIRSRVNLLLQRVPYNQFGTTAVYASIKADIMQYVNDTLEGLNFSPTVRPAIGKRRVTEVLLPMFVRQVY